MHNNQSEKIASQNKGEMFRDIDKTFGNDPEKKKYLYRKAYQNLERYKQIFLESTEAHDVEKLRNMKHNSTVLLNMFNLHLIINFLEECKTLMMDNGDREQIVVMQKKGVQLFDEALAALNAKLSS